MDESLNAKRALRNTIATTLQETEADYAQVRPRPAPHPDEGTLPDVHTPTHPPHTTWLPASVQIVDRSAALLRRLQDL